LERDGLRVTGLSNAAFDKLRRGKVGMRNAEIS
jgi:hypothetical protein